MNRIIISRTDSIGDVILTLPMAGVLKKTLPGTHILFMGRAYTQPIIEASSFIDEFIDWDSLKDLPYRNQIEAFRSFRADAIVHVFQVKQITKLADLSGIPLRIGTTHRFFTWFFCNRLIWFSRKKSALHEAQLNLKLLKPLGVSVMLSREEIPEYYGVIPHPRPLPNKGGEDLPHPRPLPNKGGEDLPHPRPLPNKGGEDAKSGKFRLILHPKSKGSAREWGLENFSRLIELLPREQYQLFITGTSDEGELIKDFLKKHREQVVDMTGKLNLKDLMAFIGSCDGLIAASTGPLHLAAAMGKIAIGLYAPIRPIFPQRWAPLGKQAGYLVKDKKNCTECRETFDCICLRSITAEEVLSKLKSIQECNNATMHE